MAVSAGVARFIRFALLFIVFGVTTGLAFPLIFGIAIWLAPNRTSDGHVVMPMGQTALAMLLSPIAGLATAIAVGKKLPRRNPF